MRVPDFDWKTLNQNLNQFMGGKDIWGGGWGGFGQFFWCKNFFFCTIPLHDIFLKMT
jgi:hypothetical protein